MSLGLLIHKIHEFVQRKSPTHWRKQHCIRKNGVDCNIQSGNYRADILRRYSLFWCLHESDNVPISVSTEWRRNTGCLFQQDNATAHMSNKSLKVLNELFRERIISKGLWPPRSPDLTPPDFFFWGVAKSNVYKNNWTEGWNKEKVFQNMCKRVELCQQQRGKHFQLLLWSRWVPDTAYLTTVTSVNICQPPLRKEFVYTLYIERNMWEQLSFLSRPPAPSQPPHCNCISNYDRKGLLCSLWMSYLIVLSLVVTL